MTKSNLSRKKNVEDIRRKNVEENQLFLKQLLMANIRDDFINSARTVLRKKENIKKSIQLERIEYSTRYHIKVKSGEISPHVPEWVRENERKKLENEQKKQEREMRQQMKQQEKLLKQEMRKQMLKMKMKERFKPSRWTLLYKNNPNPYGRTFKPRQTKIHERIEQEFMKDLHSEQD
ncbi:unnamed protein product [Adineta steineri]|uniref:Uncharacterized protein n=2 Tax=Adineta steineri TaxID=433720 RepID=A0A814KWM6_9BILA|nr:unnamed protein product [Adineta steineri]CAF3494990.1 unnamed protein product [Adineta steineri]